MANIRKISEEQFILDCINKEFKIVGSNNHWDSFEALRAWAHQPENERWYDNYGFTTVEQYHTWRDYFLEHFYDWQPKRIAKSTAVREFNWFALNWGFHYDFDTSLI